MTSEVEQPPPRAPLGGRLAWWPFLVAFLGAAVIVVAVVLINAFAGGGTTGSAQQGTGLLSDGAVACPHYYEHVQPSVGVPFPWVPAKPAGLRSKNKLVPSLHPTHVTICEYLDRSGGKPKSLSLTGQRVLTGKLDRVVDTLRPLRATHKGLSLCLSTISPKAFDQYLIAMRYAEAIVWVAAPVDRCSGASNGSFSTDANLSADARAAFAAGRWVSSK